MIKTIFDILIGFLMILVGLAAFYCALVWQ